MPTARCRLCCPVPACAGEGLSLHFLPNPGCLPAPLCSLLPPDAVTSGPGLTLLISSSDASAQNKVRNCRPLRHLSRFCLLAIAVNLAQINS